jgi:RimJ/RimL family protein N-acetyltransferase
LPDEPLDFVIRPVIPADLPGWWTLRLRAIREHPDMFGASLEENERRSPAEVERTFHERSTAGDNCLFAVFAPSGEPVATLGVVRYAGPKERHRAMIWGVYTAPEARGQGLSSRLLEAAIAHCRSLPGLLQIHLAVSSHNHGAIRVYERAGFLHYGREPRALLLPDRSVDEDLMVLFLDGYRTE